eukprot:Gb_13135 [translate_table: standard]
MCGKIISMGTWASRLQRRVVSDIAIMAWYEHANNSTGDYIIIEVLFPELSLDHKWQGQLQFSASQFLMLEVKIDFTDKETWEYLFKDYWLELKEKLSLTLVELQKAKNPFKDIEDFVEEDAESDETFDEGDESVSSSDSGSDRLVEEQRSVGLKRRKRSRTLVIGRGDVVEVGRETSRKETSVPREFSGWASEELKEFIAYVNEDPEKVISLFEVQHLLLTYIKQNKLQDPRKKSLIICDERLRSLFGKLSVGQFEMLKLLEKHFASKQTCFVQGNSMQDNQDGPANNDDNRADLDDSKDKVGRIVTDKRRKPRKKVEDKAPKSNPNDYAAINVHNVGLIYLRRALIEDLLEDLTSFDSKIIGSFVRIRIPGIGNRQEMYYRLVQVVGTRKVEEAYNTGRKTTDIMLEIANLKKKEDVSIDAVSNQDFTEVWHPPEISILSSHNRPKTARSLGLAHGNVVLLASPAVYNFLSIVFSVLLPSFHGSPKASRWKLQLCLMLCGDEYVVFSKLAISSCVSLLIHTTEEEDSAPVVALRATIKICLRAVNLVWRGPLIQFFTLFSKVDMPLP